MSSKPVMEYSYSSLSTSLSLSDELASISSSITSSRGSLEEIERLWPVGSVPGFIGVLGGRFLSNTSGDSIGPNVTLLRDRLSFGALSSALVIGTKS